MSKFLKCLISVVIAANLLITPQLCIADCGVSSSGNWSSVSWSGCSGPGGIPGPGDDVKFLNFMPPQFNVTADSDISVSSLTIIGSTLNAGAYTITLSSATIPITLDSGTFTAGTGTVLLNGDSDIKILSFCSATSTTYNNLVMGPITAPRTVSLGESGCKSLITVNGTFISGTSATNTVSFVKGDAASDVTNPVTSYYCASNGGISNINCLPGGPTAPTGFSAAAVSQTQIDLSWTCTAADETGFRIFRDGVLIDVIAGPFPEADTTTAADTTSYSDTGLTAGTTYNYEIRTAVLGTDSTGVTASATTQSAAAPEINLKQGTTDIASAGTHDFGTVAFGSNSGAIIFTIENTGSANLSLSGSPKIVKGGADAADFTVNETSTTTPVAASGSTTFTVTFTPSSAAAKTATLSIANNDSDENPYTVTLNGTGTTAPTPGYGSTPASGGIINVGSALVGASVSNTLTVSETGTATLNVTSHSLGGTNPGDFSVTPATLSIANGGVAQNLTIQCTPSAAGLRTATLTVNHNATGSPATYTLNCTGATAPVTAGVSIVSVSNVKATTALATGTASGDGITERGFFWWTDGGFTSGTVPAGSGAGDFSLTMSNLTPLTTYHVSAYIKVGADLITSGNKISFTTTGPVLPTVITKPDFTVNVSEVLAKGEITDVGSSPVTIYGFVYAVHTSPTVWDMALPFTWDMTLPISVGKAFEGTIKNLAPGTYYFRAYAHNAQGTAYGEEYSFTILNPNAPAAPGNLTATAVSQTQINLSWTDNSGNETGFRIFRNGTELTPSPKVGADITTFSDTGLTCGTPYTYIVKAMNADGDSAEITGTATTQACTGPPPAAPTGLTGTPVSQTQIDLSWTDNSNNETGFRIFRNGVELTPSPKVGVNVTTFSDTDLTCGTTYTYVVKAMNADGDSAATPAVTVTTPACPAGAPAAPTGLTATAVSQNQINLSWTDNSNNETGFKIFRDGAELTPSPKVGADITTFSDTGLACGTAYTYEVRATNADGDSAGITGTATTQACTGVTPPAAPTGLTATAVSQTQINLSWTDNSDNETGFKIFRDGVELTPSPKVGADVTTFSDTGLACGRTYTYTVKATNAGGDSAGITATATTQACPYVPPADTGGGAYVLPANQAPVADRLYISTEVNKPAAVTLSGNDPDANFLFLFLYPLSYSVSNQPRHGKLSGTPPNLTYTPDTDFVGTDSFTFRIYDGTSYSAESLVMIIVHENIHAYIGDKYELDVFCAEYQGMRYGFRLNYDPVAADPSGLYWKMDILTFGRAYSTDIKGCIPVGDDLHLNIPSAYFQGTMYQFTLNYNPIGSDAFGLYWKLDLSTLKTR